MNYFDINTKYWNNEYYAPNVENFIFRMYGRILKFDYGIDGSNGESVFDFGMGQGGNLNFFYKLGFDVFGVDIASNDIEIAKKIMPKKSHQFKVISPQPDPQKKFFPEKINGPENGFDIVISIQTFSFLSNTDSRKAIKCIYNQMKPGAKIYVSWCGENHYYKNHATPLDDGLWSVKFNNGRVNYDLRYNFVRDKNDLKERFNIFKPIYLDHYDSSFREEGSEFRYTFFGIKE